MPLFDLNGMTALITGASSGLGKRFAEVLSTKNANVAIVARRIDKLEEVKNIIEKNGGKCLVIAADATKEKDVINAVNKVVKEFGKIDILVNNAGTAAGGNMEDTTLEDFQRVVDVNLTGVYLFAREAGKNMIKNNYGRIINIASMYGVVGNKFSGAVAYHTTKGAVINFARALAAEWAKYNITVNNIGPGFFESEMTDRLFTNNDFREFVKRSSCMERAGREGELDTALLFLAAKASSYITGQTIFVDGGWTAI